MPLRLAARLHPLPLPSSSLLLSFASPLLALELELAGTDLGTTCLPSCNALSSLLVCQSVEFGPELGVVVFEITVAAKLLVKLLWRHVLAKVLIELELLLGLCDLVSVMDAGLGAARLRGLTRGSINGLMSLKKPHINHGTEQRVSAFRATYISLLAMGAYC